MASCSAYRAGGRRRKRCFSSQVAIKCDGGLLSYRWLNSCLPIGCDEWIPCFPLLMCTVFALPLNILYPNPWVFLHLPYKFSHASHQGRISGHQDGTSLPAGFKPWHIINSHTVKPMLGLQLLDPVLQEELHLYSWCTCIQTPSSQDHKTQMV